MDRGRRAGEVRIYVSVPVGEGPGDRGVDPVVVKHPDEVAVECERPRDEGHASGHDPRPAGGRTERSVRGARAHGPTGLRARSESAAAAYPWARATVASRR